MVKSIKHTYSRKNLRHSRKNLRKTKKGGGSVISVDEFMKKHNDCKIDLTNVLSCFGENKSLTCHSIGKGNFGRVYKETCKGVTGDNSVELVIKGHTESNKGTINNFIREANNNYAVSKNPTNLNVVRLLGRFVYNDKIFIIQELWGEADLQKFLDNSFINKNPTLVDKQFTIDAALQIAAGMRQIHSEDIIHLDLACRNVMVKQINDKYYIFKIGDFGLSQDVKKEQKYTMDKHEIIPVSIFPPRNTTNVRNTSNRICNKNTDIWLYCMLLYEIIIKSEFTRIHDQQNVIEYYLDANSQKNVYPFGLNPLKKNGKGKQTFPNKAFRRELLKLDNPPLTADEYLLVLFGHSIRSDKIKPYTKLGGINGAPWSDTTTFDSYMDGENDDKINKLLSLLIKGYFFTDMPLSLTPILNPNYTVPNGIDINLNGLTLTFDLIPEIIENIN